VWPLEEPGGVLGAAGPPLLASPWPRRAAVPAPAGRGGPCHGLPRPLVLPLLLPVGGNGGVGGAAGTPAKSSGGGAGALLFMGGSRTRGRRGAALPPLSSGAALQAQQAVGLPAAALHGEIEELLDERRRAMLQAGRQHLDQDLFIQPEEAKGNYDEGLHGVYPQMMVRKDPSQLLMHPGQEMLEESWVEPEKGCPGEWLETARRSPVQPALCRICLCCCRTVGGWMATSISCLVDDDGGFRRWCDHVLLKAVVRPHQVHDGLHSPLAEGALGRTLSPPQDALVTEAVEARHHVGGIIPAVQAHWAAVLHLCGHALHPLRWAGGSWTKPSLQWVTGAATAGVVLEERPRSLAGLGRGGRNAQVPPEGNPPRCPG